MKYILEVERNEDGATSMRSTNEGFNPLEILGLLAFKMDDTRRQMIGEIKPDVIKRTVIE